MLPPTRTLEWKKNFIRQGSIGVVWSALVPSESTGMLPGMISHKYDVQEPTTGVSAVPEAVESFGEPKGVPGPRSRVNRVVDMKHCVSDVNHNLEVKK